MLVRTIYHPLVLSLASGLLLSACFPGLDIGWLAFIALVPLLFALKNATALQGFGRGYLTGAVFFTFVYSWITIFTGHKLGPIGYIGGEALALIMALAFAVFGATVAALLGRESKLPRWALLIAIPSLWVLCEWARQLGSLGMGWGDLGYTQWHHSWLIRVAPLAGIWGIAWLIVLVNTALALRDTRLVVASAAAVLVACAVGVPLGASSVHASGASFPAAALQTGITQNVYWNRMRPEDPAYFSRNLNTIDAMCAEAQLQGAKLAVLSETAAPGYPRLDWPLRMALQQTAQKHHLVIISGARDIDVQSNEDENVAMLFQPGDTYASRQQVYAKQQLVPFGEFVPYDDQLPWLKAMHVLSFDDKPGNADQPDLAGTPPVGKIGTAICYESSYPRFLRQQTLVGAAILTVITYDTWYGRSAAARQHTAMSALAAAECRRSVVHCATTGISAIFAPDGRELDEAPLFTRQAVIAPVTPMRGETLFVRYGDWFVAVSAIMAFIAFLLAIKPRKQTRRCAVISDFPAPDAEPALTVSR